MLFFFRNCSIPSNSPPYNYKQFWTKYSFIHTHTTLSLNSMTILPTKQSIGPVGDVPFPI